MNFLWLLNLLLDAVLNKSVSPTLTPLRMENVTPNTFRAAVYEHSVVIPLNRIFAVDRRTALKNMMLNLNTYRRQALIASQQVRRKLHDLQR